LVFSEISRLSSRFAETEAALADANAACQAADQKLELLQNSLQTKERQIQEFEQFHSKLTDDADALLKTCKRRDAALARAEERLGLLANLLVQLEAASLPKSQNTMVNLTYRLQRELDNDKWLLAEAPPEH
jgi:chromosome segregation ATPase